MHALKEVSEKYIARIFKSIIIALDSMHKKGFVHRDFKLENAMMVCTIVSHVGVHEHMYTTYNDFFP
jgi:tRNA A-37 threonylcarbamoyl transferase component Bud32